MVGPRAFIDSDGIASTDLLSETRAPGAALCAIGALLVFAAIRRRRLGAAALISTLLYLGYGGGRLVSMAVDGMPGGTIVVATIVELALGLASLVALRVVRNPPGR